MRANIGEHGGGVCLARSPLPTPHQPTPGRRAATDIAPELRSLEVMRKFSEQYAKRWAGCLSTHKQQHGEWDDRMGFDPCSACRTGTYFCIDTSVTAVVIKGLAEHKDELGAPLCPCRHYDDKVEEAHEGFWNCPCVPMRERKVRQGGGSSAACGGGGGCTCLGSQPEAVSRYWSVPSLSPSPPPPVLTASHMQECHCMLFLTPDNDFAGEEQTLSLADVIEATKGL